MTPPITPEGPYSLGQKLIDTVITNDFELEIANEAFAQGVASERARWEKLKASLSNQKKGYDERHEELRKKLALVRNDRDVLDVYNEQMESMEHYSTEIQCVLDKMTELESQEGSQQ